MSVEVKTPTKAQFEHPEFTCGGRDTAALSVNQQQNPEKPFETIVQIDTDVTSHRKRPNTLPLSKSPDAFGTTQPKYVRKRRNTYTASGDRAGERSVGGTTANPRKRFRKERIVPIRNFQLGGNINDPLNLESMCDEDINRALNENTPHSSPLPLPAHRRQQVQVLIPPNITDPLNLNSGEDMDPNLLSPKAQGRKKRKKSHRKRNQSSIETPSTTLEEGDNLDRDFSRPVHIEIASDSELQGVSVARSDLESPPLNKTPVEASVRKIIDKIVSPVIPQISPKRKRKRTSSEGSGGSISRAILREDTSPKRPKFRRTISSHSSTSITSTVKPKPKTAKWGKPQKKFIYGNYNRYYGYRNPDSEQDDRLRCLKKDWFEMRDVLDIGCNVGHVTLAIAKNFQPRKIVGMDIDGSLIAAARRNIRNHLSNDLTDTSKFPSTMSQCYGPIAAPPALDVNNTYPLFPENVTFVQGNYVLEHDELLEMQHEEYDVIMALSITKWIHFNWGDAGLKRFFKRIYRQLRPGGKLILEPQAWASYKKKKKLTEDISRNFSEIKLRPEQFSDYLRSREVGFSTCELVDMPFNKAKGFQRPIQVFSKSDTAQVTPRVDLWSTVATPSYAIDSRNATPSYLLDSRGATPNFQIGSSGNVTPASSGRLSHLNTPKRDDDSQLQIPSGVAPMSTIPTTGEESMLIESTTEEKSMLIPHNEVKKDVEVCEDRCLADLRSTSCPGLLESQTFSNAMSSICEESLESTEVQRTLKKTNSTTALEDVSLDLLEKQDVKNIIEPEGAFAKDDNKRTGVCIEQKLKADTPAEKICTLTQDIKTDTATTLNNDVSDS